MWIPGWRMGGGTLRDVLIARHGAVVHAVLVAPSELLGEDFVLEGLVRERRDGVVATPNDASLLGGSAVPHLVITTRASQRGGMDARTDNRASHLVHAHAWFRVRKHHRSKGGEHG